MTSLAGVTLLCVARGAKAQGAVPAPGAPAAATDGAGSVQPATAVSHDSWQDYERQSDAAGSAVPPPSVLTPGLSHPADEEVRRVLQSVEMRNAAESEAPTLQLVLGSATAALTVGGALPTLLFAAGAGPCRVASCKDLETQLWVAGGITLGFAILTEQLLHAVGTTQAERYELNGDADALTKLLPLINPTVHFSGARDATLARAAQDLERLLQVRQAERMEPAAMLLGVSAGGALVFGTYAVLFAATADATRPRHTEIAVFGAAAGVSVALSALALFWLQNVLGHRDELGKRIEIGRSELQALLTSGASTH